MYESETAERLSQPGVAVGLAWTVLGGEIMFVEATKMEGEGKLTLTGQLGDIMKESASLALNWVRSHANEVRQLRPVKLSHSPFTHSLLIFVGDYLPKNNYENCKTGWIRILHKCPNIKRWHLVTEHDVTMILHHGLYTLS